MAGNAATIRKQYLKPIIPTFIPFSILFYEH